MRFTLFTLRQSSLLHYILYYVCCAVFIYTTVQNAHIAHAQVITNSQALNQLGATPPHNSLTSHTLPKKKHIHSTHQHSRHNTKQYKTVQRHIPTQTSHIHHSTISSVSIPSIPLTPPPLPTLTPISPVIKTHSFPMPPLPTIVKNATGTVYVIPNGICLTFAPGSDHLNPKTHQALLNFVKNFTTHQRVIIDAYSSGDKDDPSLPRRMAFARGLAARSVLMHAGIPSTRINLHVIGIPQAKSLTNTLSNVLPHVTQDHIDVYISSSFIR